MAKECLCWAEAKSRLTTQTEIVLDLLRNTRRGCAEAAGALHDTKLGSSPTGADVGRRWDACERVTADLARLQQYYCCAAKTLLQTIAGELSEFVQRDLPAKSAVEVRQLLHRCRQAC